MPRSSHWLNPRSLLTISTIALFVLALMPVRYLGWVTWIADGPVTLCTAPIERTLGLVVNRFVDRRENDGADSTQNNALVARVQQLEFELLNQQSENEKLRAQVAEYQLGLSLNPDVPRQLFARIIGGGADLSAGIIKAKAGSNEGVEVGSVAVVKGVNLVGRVARVESRFCFILPITERASGRIEGLIMLGDKESGPACSLTPSGAGALQGPVIYPADQPQVIAAIRPGLLVRLADGRWPASSQMLVLGLIDRVDLATNQRQIVTVRPVVPLDRVPEVVLRIPAPQPAATPGGKTPP
jgi:hypothetical protein